MRFVLRGGPLSLSRQIGRQRQPRSPRSAGIGSAGVGFLALYLLAWLTIGHYRWAKRKQEKKARVRRVWPTWLIWTLCGVITVIILIVV